MGMAASQARYLALTARKTNTEYEGQQINQARTALANQSANLFNRLLNMEVPNPPKTTDYTKVQYSYSDGENASVIDEWQQLSGVNPDYNYLVKSHYYASLYTGALRQLTDPQVQIAGNGTVMDDWNTISLNRQLLDTADSAQQTAYNDLQQITSREEIHILNKQTEAYINNAQNSLISDAINYCSYDDQTATYTLRQGTNTYTVKDLHDEALISDDVASVLQGVQDMIDTNLIDVNTLNEYLFASGSDIIINDDNISQITENISNPSVDLNRTQKDILKIFGLEEDGNISRIVKLSDVERINLDTDETGYTNLNHTYRLEGIFREDSTNPPTQNTPQSLNSLASNIRGHIDTITEYKDNYDQLYANYQRLLDNYNNNTTKPTYIGNSPLTPLTELNDEQKVELLQVVKDMNAQDIDTDILNCFDEENNYLGGIYSFQMNGTTYYTTHNSLVEAYASYPANRSNNNIDAQYKMPYYNASYIDTRIEKEAYALLETDGTGRFKTVKFDNDSIVYSLNTETVTDEAAYQDAMNKYLYEKDKYEKTIADINAKTSIIQKEDRTLELRLKQLDTEQNALKTEMDAVKKVIKDNIEATFKTFSD